MAVGTCVICDADLVPGARHCSACGADPDAAVIEIVRSDGPAPADPAGPRTGSRRRTVATLACLVALGAGTWAVASRDGEPPEPATDVPAPSVDRSQGPTPTPSIDGVGNAPGGSSTGTPARPDAPVFSAVATIDPALLPNLAASHLAIAGDQALHLLDLTTGTWTRRPLQNTPSAVYGVDGGVVMAGFIGGRLAFVPVEDGEAVPLGGAENELLRVGSDDVVVRRWTAAPPEIASISFDGRVRWRFEPRPGTSVIGVTSRGEVLVESARAIVAVDPVRGITRQVVDGRPQRGSGARGRNGDRTAYDATGVSVSTEDSAVVFRAGDGTVVATLASPVTRGAAKVALVPAAVTP